MNQDHPQPKPHSGSVSGPPKPPKRTARALGEPDPGDPNWLSPEQRKELIRYLHAELAQTTPQPTGVDQNQAS